jgi:uncharacterized radical SAM superfamily Fe-S cluster-containing enzyme
MNLKIPTFTFLNNQKLSTASIIKINNKIFLEKKYYGGVTRILLENDPHFYKKIFFHKHDSIPTISLYDLEQNKNKISSILFYITNRCNMHCNVCYENAGENNPKKEISIKEIRKVVSKVRGKYIVLLGGEPTVKKNLFRIIELITKNGNIASLHTNGIKLANLKYSKKLKESGLNVVHLSFNSFSDCINEKINNIPLLKIRLKALENIKKSGMKAVLSTNIIKDVNENEIGKLVNFVFKNSDFIKGIFLRPMLHDGRVNINAKELTMSDIIEKIEKEIKGINKQHFIENRKLRINVFKIAKMFLDKDGAEKFSPEIALSILLRKKNKKWEVYPELELLKKLNRLMVKCKNKRELIVNSIKNLPLILKFLFQKTTIQIIISLIKNRFETASVADSLLQHKDIVRIWVDVIQTPKNVDLLNPSKTYLFNKEDKISPLLLVYGIR